MRHGVVRDTPRLEKPFLGRAFGGLMSLADQAIRVHPFIQLPMCWLFPNIPVNDRFR
jgi:hypothetical protein